MPPTRVFVYGTLKPEEANYAICQPWVSSAQAAIVHGELYALPIGYPVLTVGTTPIQGYVLSLVHDRALAALDRYEQHDPDAFRLIYPGRAAQRFDYARQSIPIFDLSGQPIGTAWAYTMTTKQVNQLGGHRLAEGLWTRQMQQAIFG